MDGSCLRESWRLQKSINPAHAAEEQKRTAQMFETVLILAVCDRSLRHTGFDMGWLISPRFKASALIS
jgi:hypothetical protein